MILEPVREVCAELTLTWSIDAPTTLANGAKIESMSWMHQLSGYKFAYIKEKRREESWGDSGQFRHDL